MDIASAASFNDLFANITTNIALPEVATASANFDIYVLSQSWQPYFCTTGNYQGCRNPTNIMQSQLTIHGLWPNSDQGPAPVDCEGPALTDDDIAAAGADDVANYWPDVKTGGWTFVSNEWSKHGTCSGLSAASYVKAALDLQKLVGTPDVISMNIGRNNILAGDIRTAYGSDYVSLICKGSNHALSEVRTCFSSDLKNQIPCPYYILKQDTCGKQRNSRVSIYSFN
ncbi:Aste57867_11772 [Aphanomyces stellatus]|uniref:Aste57867_11772 protein n=1 Tax=Aphanomyces stellatus TaxID=120398 RepID=A0A485KVT9_9STRA|nr:hypothetical protein As57867_011727 [Aphanomyces stellatus]VFT88628.1 Aste57867_11772 [Aphanomyces stellatus]